MYQFLLKMMNNNMGKNNQKDSASHPVQIPGDRLYEMGNGQDKMNVKIWEGWDGILDERGWTVP